MASNAVTQTGCTALPRPGRLTWLLLADAAGWGVAARGRQGHAGRGDSGAAPGGRPRSRRGAHMEACGAGRGGTCRKGGETAARGGARRSWAAGPADPCWADWPALDRPACAAHSTCSRPRNDPAAPTAAAAAPARRAPAPRSPAADAPPWHEERTPARQAEQCCWSLTSQAVEHIPVGVQTR